MQSKIGDNRQASDDKMNTCDIKLDKITVIIENIMVHNKNSNTSPYKLDSPKAQDPNTAVLTNKKALPLEGGNSSKLVLCGLSNMRLSHQNSMKSSSRHN